jgi:ATP synthase protein I
VPAIYARIVRRSAAVTAVAALIAVAVSWGVVGTKGLVGALLGVALVAVFFAISVLAVGRAAQISPQAMMITAVVTYIVKIIVLLVFIVGLSSTTAFSTRAFGLSALACILVWCFAQVTWSLRLKFLYVEPRGQG